MKPNFVFIFIFFKHFLFKNYDKHDDFDFDMLNFLLFLDGNVPCSTSNGFYSSEHNRLD